jgi:hypothetical protein
MVQIEQDDIHGSPREFLEGLWPAGRGTDFRLLAVLTVEKATNERGLRLWTFDQQDLHRIPLSPYRLLWGEFYSRGLRLGRLGEGADCLLAELVA